MFSDEKFIKASRDFVCVRLETYESKEHEELIRKLYDGRFTNTIFCVLAPDGTTKLTRTHRSPEMAMGGRRGADGDRSARVIEGMKEISEKYTRKGTEEPAVLQDFNSFGQALRTASGDQRLLVLVASSDETAMKETRSKLAPVFSNDEVIGRYHLDFESAGEDTKWAEQLSNQATESGMFFIKPSKFGQSGEVLKKLPLASDAEAILATLAAANETYAKTEERKVYSDHIVAGRSSEIYFQNVIPYGEDRDGDGEIDHKGKGSRKGGKGGKGDRGKGKGDGGE